jgi:predicted O-methyltransferase YrrM
MCPSYIIGHEQERHTIADNKFEVPTSFRYVVDYRAIDAQTIINDINEFSNLLRQYGEFNTIERRLIKPVTRYTAHYSNRDVVGVVVGYQNPAMIGNTVNLLNMKKLYLVGKPSENEENLGNLTERLDEYNKADKIHWIATDINEGADEIKEELDFVYIEDLNISNEEVAKYFNKLKSGGAIGSGNLANWMKRGMPLPWRKAYCGVEHDVVHKFSDKATNTGWYTIKGGLLRDSMQRLKDGKNLVGVEIGVYFGENSKSILDNLDIKKLYLVDPYEEGLVGIKEKNAPQFIRNGAYSLLHSHSSKIEWIKKKSQDAVEDVPDNLDFVYIDGDHSYEGAKRDIELYWPKIKEGGILAGHDFDNENVAKAVKDYFEGRDNMITFTGVDRDNTVEFWIHKVDNLSESVLSEGVQAFDKIIKKRNKDNRRGIRIMDFFSDRPFFKSLLDKYDLVGAEIGVDSAVNAHNIMTNLDMKKLYLIDPWCNYGGLKYHGVIEEDDIAQICYEHSLKVMEKFGDRVVFIRELSEDAVDKIGDSLDFVYIDGNHRYEYVKKDIELYYPKVKMGGVVAGHDFKSGEPGVKKAVEECFGSDFERFGKSWDWMHLKKEF